MLGKITGKLDEILEDHCILMVGGLGYKIYLASNNLKILKEGEEKTFYLETILKDEIPRLYGFASKDEQGLFLKLLDVKGVGGRMALNLIGYLGSRGLKEAIKGEQHKILQAVPGVGGKLASRLISELQNLEINNELSGVREEALSGLINMGFNHKQSLLALEEVLKEGNLDLNTVIKLSLKILTRA